MLNRAVGPLFIVAGALHFAFPKSYEAMMPGYLPAHRELVYVSGIAEIAGGAGLMYPGTRRWAGRWLIATLFAVFPANVNMAVNRIFIDSPLILWGRLPFQIVLIVWAWWFTRPDTQSKS